MRTKLPETCTDPSLIVDLSFTFTPDETLVVDARDTVQINEAFFDALFKHVINMCGPYIRERVVIERTDGELRRGVIEDVFEGSVILHSYEHNRISIQIDLISNIRYIGRHNI